MESHENQLKPKTSPVRKISRKTSVKPTYNTNTLTSKSSHVVEITPTLEENLLYYGALGNTTMVSFYLSEGADPDACDNKQMTVMHYAAKYGYADIADMLLSNYDSLVKRALMKEESSPFYLAMDYDQTIIIKKILSKFTLNTGDLLCYAIRKGLFNTVHTLLACNVNASSLDTDGIHPLYYATHSIPIMNLLINKGADVNSSAKNSTIVTPLNTATCQGLTNIVQLLLEYNAEVNTKGIEKFTPLHHAAQKGYIDIVLLLLDYGADITAQTKDGRTPADIANGEIKQLLIKYGNKNNDLIKLHTPENKLLYKSTLERSLFYHGALGDYAKVCDILSEDINPNICDQAKLTLMHYAAQYGYTDIVDALLKHPALITTHIADGSKSPFYLAMQHSQREVIELILKTCEIKNKELALCYATKKGLLNVISALLTHKIDPNLLDVEKFSPLCLAAKEGDSYLPIMQLLINNGADINNNMNHVGNTPLHFASIFGFLHIVRFLIANGADVNIKNNANITPLHAAAEAGHVTIVKMLLNSDAQINEKNNDQKTPLDVAKTDEIKNILIKHEKKLKKNSDSENCVIQ